MKEAIDKSSDALNNKGVILYPTATVFGLGCFYDNPEGIEKINQLKNRPENKSVIILISSYEDLKELNIKPTNTEREALLASRPTTVIFKASNKIPKEICAQDGTFAVRITQSSFCKGLISKCKKPITSTSANISGQPTPTLLSEVHSTILDGVDYVVNLPEFSELKGKPSRIVKEENGRLIVIRA